MLTEHFVASIQTPLKAAAADSKDVGIFLHELQPLAGSRHTFKKSLTAQNCLAVSETHIFAAQSEKATVHVYNREKGTHEATVPFNEKITSLVLAASGLVLLLGTDGGRVMAWELATGRLSSASHAHLQAVTSLSVDAASNFLLSGSQDANVLVWSLSDLLSFTSSDPSGASSISPIHSLSSQRGPITALEVGHGQGPAYIAVSASEDQTAVVWDCKTGSVLRTYLLRSTPRALVMDKCDRGFYTTYDDGSVQLVDFYGDGSTVSTIYDEKVTAPVQPGDKNLWKAEGQELGSGLSLALSWDSTRLLSGHRSGKIAAWDISKGSFMAILATLPGTVSNITILPVTGAGPLEMRTSSIWTTDTSKPRMVNTETGGVVPGNYSVSAQLKTNLLAMQFRATNASSGRKQTSFQSALAQASYSPAVLESGLVELSTTEPQFSRAVNGESVLGPEAHDSEQNARELADLREQNQSLVEQINHLKKLQKASFVQLRDKTMAISALQKDHEQLAEIAKHDYGWDFNDSNVEWSLHQQRLKE